VRDMRQNHAQLTALGPGWRRVPAPDVRRPLCELRAFGWGVFRWLRQSVRFFWVRTWFRYYRRALPDESGVKMKRRILYARARWYDRVAGCPRDSSTASQRATA